MSKYEETWKRGWACDRTTIRQAPRWSVSPAGKFESIVPVVTNPSKNTTVKVGGGFRKTWIQSSMSKQVNPGPGTYRTDTDLPSDDKDQYDVRASVHDRSPIVSIGKEAKEVILNKVKLSILKPSYLNVPVASSSAMKTTPGPGQYTQYSSFGEAHKPNMKV